MYYLVIIFGIATMHVFHFVVIISTLNFYVKSDFTIFWHFLTKKKSNMVIFGIATMFFCYDY